jgi:hypothetical protein
MGKGEAKMTDKNKYVLAEIARRPDWENFGSLMPVNPAYRELVERRALAGMTPRQI